MAAGEHSPALHNGRTSRRWHRAPTGLPAEDCTPAHLTCLAQGSRHDTPRMSRSRTESRRPSSPISLPKVAVARPLDMLAFLLPLIVFYEVTSLTHRQQIVAHVLLRRFMEWFGYVGVWAPGLAIVVILLATHVASKQTWAIGWSHVGWMYVESVIAALPLLAMHWTGPLQAHSSGSPVLGSLGLAVGARRLRGAGLSAGAGFAHPDRGGGPPGPESAADGDCRCRDFLAPFRRPPPSADRHGRVSPGEVPVSDVGRRLPGCDFLVSRIRARGRLPRGLQRGVDPRRLTVWTVLGDAVQYCSMQEIEPPVPSTTRLRRFLFGEPRNLEDRGLAHQIALVPLLAWIGLGADGLSSSAYGPEEAYRALGEHTYLAIPLALVVTLMVFTLCACYSKIIEHFPQGGGGYVVSTALLGSTPGAISGCALGGLRPDGDGFDRGRGIGDVQPGPKRMAVSSHPSGNWAHRHAGVPEHPGVRESVIVLAPIFLVFIVTHVVAIVGAIAGHLPAFPATLQHCADGFRSGWATLGLAGLLNTFIFAFSMGGGTYTGIEAVSNGLSIMREPRVKTAKRTMLYIGISLSFVAAGLLACYLLWDVTTNEAH